MAGAIASCMGISAGGAAKDIKRRIAFALIKCHAEAVLTCVGPQIPLVYVMTSSQVH
jgi:hypothetical protein